MVRWLKERIAAGDGCENFHCFRAQREPLYPDKVWGDRILTMPEEEFDVLSLEEQRKIILSLPKY